MNNRLSPVLPPLIFVLFFSTLFLLPTASSLAATQVIQNGTENGAIRVSVQDLGQMGVWRCGATQCGDVTSNTGWVSQTMNEYSTASILFLDGTNTGMQFSSSSFPDRFYAIPPGAVLTPISNTIKTSNSITSVFLAYKASVWIIQTTSITPGTHYYKTRWDIKNFHQTATYNNLRFSHSVDTNLAGTDIGEGHFDDTLNMVSISNHNTADRTANMMGLYAGPDSPPSFYFQGYFFTNFDRAQFWMHENFDPAIGKWELDNTVNPLKPHELDAGYSLGWLRDSLAPGETWTITAYEKVLQASDVMIIAPAEQTGAPGTIVTYPFIVKNLDGNDATIFLSAASASRWPVSIQDASSNPITSVDLPGGGQATVYVNVSIPSTAAAGNTDPVTLTGSATGSIPNSDSTITTVSAAGAGLTPDPDDLPLSGLRGNGSCGIVVGFGENETPGPVTGAKLTAIYFAILLAPVALLKWRRRAKKQDRANKPCPHDEANAGQEEPPSPEET